MCHFQMSGSLALKVGLKGGRAGTWDDAESTKPSRSILHARFPWVTAWGSLKSFSTTSAVNFPPKSDGVLASDLTRDLAKQ
jgi:hypothetical protein